MVGAPRAETLTVAVITLYEVQIVDNDGVYHSWLELPGGDFFESSIWDEPDVNINIIWFEV